MGRRMKVCMGKGRLRHPAISFPADTACPLCPVKRGKNPTAQQNFRKAVLAAYGNRCAYSDANGVQCSVTSPLEAAHIVRYVDGGGDDVSNGVALCHEHHLAFDRRPRS